MVGGCICVLADRVDCKAGTVCVPPGTDDEQPCPDVRLGVVLVRGGVAVYGAMATTVGCMMAAVDCPRLGSVTPKREDDTVCAPPGTDDEQPCPGLA